VRLEYAMPYEKLEKVTELLSINNRPLTGNLKIVEKGGR